MSFILLTTEASMYLPPQQETSIYFVRDIVHGRKEVGILIYAHHYLAFFLDEMKARFVPKYKYWEYKTLSYSFKQKYIEEQTIYWELSRANNE